MSYMAWKQTGHHLWRHGYEDYRAEIIWGITHTHTHTHTHTADIRRHFLHQAGLQQAAAFMISPLRYYHKSWIFQTRFLTSNTFRRLQSAGVRNGLHKSLVACDQQGSEQRHCHRSALTKTDDITGIYLPSLNPILPCYHLSRRQRHLT